MATAEPLPQAKFTPPTVLVGDVILWYPSGDKSSKPVPAVATQINSTGTITLYVTLQGMNRVAVRHVDDPMLKIVASTGNGAWDIGGSHRLVLEAAAAIGRAASAIAALQSQVEALQDQLSECRKELFGPSAKPQTAVSKA